MSTRIYTRSGDDGSTGLIGGRRVPKSGPRLDACGTVDELNAALGWCAAALAMADPGRSAEDEAALIERLRRVQNELFVVGAHLAAPDASAKQAASLPPLDDAMVARLEEEIDTAEARLAKLTQFILPGGTEAASRLHLARAVCRRAERGVVALAGSAPDAQGAVPPDVVRYLNRLSDWLFVQARHVNHAARVDDVPWVK